MILLILFAFLAGIVTILSPCILPILPVILASSAGQGRARPYGIVLGFIASFTFFTLFLSIIVRWLGVPSTSLRIGAIIIIVAMGLSLLLPGTTVILEKLWNRLASHLPTSNNQSGFGAGLLTGLSLGILWTPCVGPILAAVIALALSGTVTLITFFITLAFSLGTSLPMLAIIVGGQRLWQRAPWMLRHTQQIQQGFGIVMIITGLALATNLDQRFQLWVAQYWPQSTEFLTNLEKNDIIQQQLTKLRPNIPGGSMFSFLSSATAAPDFSGGTHWINSPPLKLADLKGKVVLVDFWTYSCINCLRTLPYLKDWYAKYQNQGFVIIGVHTPEFEFEKDTTNVTKAALSLGVTYPVVQDNNYSIWNAYHNQYWPAHYLLDKDGIVRHTHFGEGAYLETENEIRQLLGETPMASSLPEPATINRPLTSETYLGYKRAASYDPQLNMVVDKPQNYTFHEPLPTDGVGLQGNWTVGAEAIWAGSAPARLAINFAASQVYLVLSANATTAPAHLQVQLDGQPLAKKYWTKDMDEQGMITVTDARKYDILNLGADYGRHTLSLDFDNGIRAYAFTFGNEITR
jgi:cytochrome c biogenesis protein CcdA/thiol-disulfide isomerase/thioredoxin